MNNKTNTVLIAKDIDINLVKHYVGRDKDNLYLVTPKIESIKLKIALDELQVITLLDEDILPFSTFQKNFSKKNLRLGWYYQQFLKYAVVERIGGRVLVVDGDSYLNFTDLSDCIVYSKGARYVADYDNLVCKLFSINNVRNRKSYIVNFMIFDSNMLQKMYRFCGLHLFENFIAHISYLLETDPSLQFSEYQTYARFMEEIGFVSSKQIRVFRRMDLINLNVDDALKKYGLVSFEKNHQSGLIRRIRAFIYFSLGKTLN